VSNLPSSNAAGELPEGVHPTTIDEIVARFGAGSTRRRVLGERLRRIHALAAASGHLARFIVFGSFVSSVPEPNDVDVFLLMDDDFDAGQTRGEQAILFDHRAAQAYFGASVFWLRRLAALDGEDAAIAHWQVKRDGSRRGIVEIIDDRE